MVTSCNGRIELPEAIQRLINGALESGNPLLLAAVSGAGVPLLSFRGSAQVYDAGSIGLWVRNATGATLDAIQQNPNVALMYRSPEVPFLQLRGQARICSDPVVRSRIFDQSPERERLSDPERRGVAVHITLTLVEGVLGFSGGQPNRIRLESVTPV